MRNLRQTQTVSTLKFHRSNSAQRAKSLNKMGKSVVIVGGLSALSFLGAATAASAQTTTTSPTAASLLPAVTTTTVLGVGVTTLPSLTATTVAGSPLPTALTAIQVSPSSTVLSSTPTTPPLPAPTIATPTLPPVTLAPVALTPLPATPVSNTLVAEAEELPVGGVDAGQGGSATTDSTSALAFALAAGFGTAVFASYRLRRSRETSHIPHKPTSD